MALYFETIVKVCHTFQRLWRLYRTEPILWAEKKKVCLDEASFSQDFWWYIDRQLCLTFACMSFCGEEDTEGG